ncbi:MAG: biotin/lipoyl-binding protein [Chloroflexota bacterium]|jgi:biotin carboxyl carrier protein
MRFRVLLNEEEKEIEIVRQAEQLTISYDGQTFNARIIHTDGAHFVLEVEEPGPGEFVNRKQIRAAGYADGDQRQLWSNGRLVHYKRLREGASGTFDAQAASLSASIPAVVSEILVQVGDRVSNGDKLILLESMKMILPIVAPCDGQIAAIHCQPGEAVQTGIQLVEIDKGD